MNNINIIKERIATPTEVFESLSGSLNEKVICENTTFNTVTECCWMPGNDIDFCTVKDGEIRSRYFKHFTCKNVEEMKTEGYFKDNLKWYIGYFED